MVAKSTDIDFLKSDKTSLTELTNSEFCKTEEELDWLQVTGVLKVPCEEVSDLISLAPASQEAAFLSEDEHEEGESSMARVSDKVPLAGRTKSITSTDVG
jgi:hypothetical protein